MEGLTEGRIVRFVIAVRGERVPALIAKVYDRDNGDVELYVFDPDGGPRWARASYSETREHEAAQTGTWHWTPRARD